MVPATDDQTVTHTVRWRRANALSGGRGAGVLATVLASLAAMYWFLPSAGLGISEGAHRIFLGLLAATACGVAWLNHKLRTAEAAQRAAADLATVRAERLDAIINTTVDGIIVISANGLIEAFNHGAERLFGYPASEVIGRNVSLLMPSPDHEQHDSYLERYLATRAASIIGIGREVTGRRRDGSEFPLHLSVGEMVIGGERKFTGMLHDVTARVRLEGQLRASEARWRSIIHSAVDGIIVIDAYGRIEAVNPAAVRLFGYEESEILGQNVNLLMPAPYREEHDTYLSRYLATGRAKIIGVGREVKGRRKDGTVFPLHLSVGEIASQGERKFTGIVHDLTARVQMEQQLSDQQSLVRLGEMAAVLAHEIKNPLAGIRGVIEVMGSHVPADDPDASLLTEAIARIDSLDVMMRELLLFARPPAPRPAPTELAPLIATTARLLSRDRALNGLEVEIQGWAPPIPADAEMLKIVFQNLLINGADAMQGRGKIRVAIDVMSETCHIAFTDQGSGIPAEVREKIFVPFFTTKSRGTGLGLPTAKRLIEAHRGRISIDCPPGGGTTVLVQLPTSF